jgi:hypothetical protein
LQKRIVLSLLLVVLGKKPPSKSADVTITKASNILTTNFIFAEASHKSQNL